MPLRPFLLLLLMILIAGCSEMKGLQELTGENANSAASNNPGGLVQEFELVMADKSDGTDQSLLQAANRIEAANMATNDPLVDVIEIRRNEAERQLYIAMVYFLPLDPTVLSSQAEGDFLDRLRMSIETAWLATRLESEGLDTIHIDMIERQQVMTFDNGESVTGLIHYSVSIARDDAFAYLNSRPHTLNDFQGLIAEGILSFQPYSGFGASYMGQPNHPMIFDDAQ